MPMVLHELNNATQFLTMLHSVHKQDPSSGALDRSSGALSDTAASVDDLGLLMAILSTASGTDLLLERKSSQGLRVALAMTIRAVRKRGVEVTTREGRTLLADSEAARGWELPWALGASVWIAAKAATEGDCLRLELDDRGWGSDLGAGELMSAHGRAVEAALPGVSFEADRQGWRFSYPAGWVKLHEG